MLGLLSLLLLGVRSWDYDDPGDWHNQYPSCGGRHQSPIDLSSTALESQSLAALDANWHAKAGALVTNTGHAIKIDLEGDLMGGPLSHYYNLRQFHFHTPSEHTIDDEHFPMEGHFVHELPHSSSSDEDATKYAVIGIFWKEGDEDETLSSIVDVLDAIPQAGNTTTTSIDVDALDSLASGPYWTYSGSLTTPGCDEDVTWMILDTFRTASKHQIEAFKEMYHHSNNRPVQKLNGRDVQWYSGNAGPPLWVLVAVAILVTFLITGAVAAAVVGWWWMQKQRRKDLKMLDLGPDVDGEEDYTALVGHDEPEEV